MINTQHKYHYGYKPKYDNKVDKIDKSINKITQAQWNLIKFIEQYTPHRFSEYEQTRKGASEFISEYQDELNQVRQQAKDELDSMPNEDKVLLKRGVSSEALRTLREIERVSGKSFSEYRQIRMEAYRFIEENKECLV